MLTTEIATTKFYTIAGYLEMEDASETRHEFHDGIIKELAGGILAHNVIKGEAYTLINLALKQAKVPYMILNSDTKVHIEAHNRFVYPDLTISDGTPEYYTTPEGKLRRDAIINPLVIFEVLSEDTRSSDKGEKYELYCTVPGFREYIVIEPETFWVKSLYLQDPENNLWKHEILTGHTATLNVHSLNLQISLDELYAALERLPK